MEEDKSSNIVKPRWPAGLVILAYLLFEYIGFSPLIRARIEAPRLAEHGISTVAEVFDPSYQAEFSYFIINLYLLSFRFSADDPERGQAVMFSDSQFVSEDIWQRLTAGDHVTVICLPSDPRVSRLARNDSDDTDLDDFLIDVLVLGLPIILSLWAGLRWMKEWIDRQNTMP